MVRVEFEFDWAEADARDCAREAPEPEHGRVEQLADVEVGGLFFLEKGAGCQEEGPVRRPFKPVVEVLELLLAVQKWELLSLVF